MTGRPLLAYALGAALLVAPACGARQERLGAGEDVGFCMAWDEFDGLEEPQLTDREESLRWAEGALRIVDRVDLRTEIDDKAPPKGMQRVLDALEGDLEVYRDAVEEADSADALRRAAAELSSSGFDERTDGLTDILNETCTKEDRGQ